MKPSDYIQKIKDKKIFTVSFSSWENSTTVPFKFNYPKIENSCNIYIVFQNYILINDYYEDNTKCHVIVHNHTHYI